MGNGTSINPHLQNNGTDLNTEALETPRSKNTDLNTLAAEGSVVKPGDILCGKYTVQEKLDVQSGEADLYFCCHGRGKYVAKVYRRKAAIKKDVTDALAGVYSPFIAQIFDLGEFNGFPVEILPFYQNGSVQGKRFTYEQLKQNIVPALNEGLRVLHENGIIHKDLKPSNIMLNADGRTVSIIDFGISSIREGTNSVIVTETGMTPEYSAPETFRSLYLNESDYYSLGITVYELFTGKTPYSHLDEEEIARLVSIQKVPLPDDMPDDLKALIIGLTYYDIRNRNDKTNPNRRWTYEEVRNWCDGIQQPVPGISADYEVGDTDHIRPYRFLGHTYTTNRDLAQALYENWEEGKKQLFRGLLSAHYKQFDPELASFLMDTEEAAEAKDTDALFFNALYNMDPELTDFVWKDRKYRGLKEIGDKLMDCLRRNDTSMDAFIDEILNKGILSIYYMLLHDVKKTDAHVRTLQAYESRRRGIPADSREKMVENYQLAYLLSGEKNFVTGGIVFRSPDELTEYMSELLDESLDSFNAFCDRLIANPGILDVQFEGWLIALGNKEKIAQWRASLR